MTNIAEAITTLLEMAELEVNDIDWFVPHQANKRIIDGWRKVGAAEKTILTVDHPFAPPLHVPLALNEAVERPDQCR